MSHALTTWSGCERARSTSAISGCFIFGPPRRVEAKPTKVGSRRRVGPRRFFFLLLPPAQSFSLSGGLLLVEFWSCFGRSGPQMCLFSPLGCLVKPRRPFLRSKVVVADKPEGISKNKLRDRFVAFAVGRCCGESVSPTRRTQEQSVHAEDAPTGPILWE